MTKIELPLQAFALSIGIQGESGPITPTDVTVLEIDHAGLSAAMLRQMAPDVVISWLFCDRYDVYDIAAILTDAGFEGRFVAVSGPLPKKALVMREIRRCFPSLDFHLDCPSTLSDKVQSYYRFIAGASSEMVGKPPLTPELFET